MFDDIDRYVRMKLIDLNAEFIKYGNNKIFHGIDSISDADGVLFLCPVCFKNNRGPVGTHRIICWRPHVPKEFPPGPGRWEFEGSGLHDLTLVAKSSSIKLDSFCNAHFFVKNGKIK